MTIEQFKKLNIGDTVFVSINSGACGVLEYQYIGVFTSHNGTKERKHVFLSPHFVSTVTILFEKEERSRSIKNIFLTEAEAKDRVKEPSFEY